MKLYYLPLLTLTFLAATLAGCHSSIVPLKPSALGPPWALSRPLQTAHPATRPHAALTRAARHSPSHPTIADNGKWFINARNGTSRKITIARYKNIWRQTQHLLVRMGYTIQWASYRLGVITTRYRTGPEILQWWRADATTFPELMEGTINTFRRTIRIVIRRSAHPHTFSITVEALVERQENPQGTVGNVAFYGASAFGNNPLPLNSHHTLASDGGPYWMRVGHDPALEKKILHRLFRKF